ncbi:glutaredoxin family protein [Agromyces sp. Soil535]|uniref:glutaredoxin family protein n=1 Tax=Agromyces sp. Soil535 TaxID=1736390 RepID=UPI0006F73EA9|nr:glutaredoxin family protein [Agromyces sp. Soil535]KRE28283.1 hypothetical protein ASG80_21440 [Agromyces sp. Soil535]
MSTSLPTRPRLTVYSKPNCGPCMATYRALDAKGIPFEVVDLTATPAAIAYVTEELGYTQSPVVVDNTDEQNHWSGFRPDRIDALLQGLD